MQGEIRRRLRDLKIAIDAKSMPLSDAMTELIELFEEHITATEQRFRRFEQEEID